MSPRAKATKVLVSDPKHSLFFALLKRANLPVPACEVQFDAVRKWRFDYAWPESLVALEVEGGIFVQGRHSRGAGMLKDMAKYNQAAALGYRVLRVTPRLLNDLTTIDLIARTLALPNKGV